MVGGVVGGWSVTSKQTSIRMKIYTRERLGCLTVTSRVGDGDGFTQRETWRRRRFLTKHSQTAQFPQTSHRSSRLHIHSRPPGMFFAGLLGRFYSGCDESSIGYLQSPTSWRARLFSHHRLAHLLLDPCLCPRRFRGPHQGH